LSNVNGHQQNPNRSSLDWYPTDPDWVAPLLDIVSFKGVIYEPCAGDGCMMDCLPGKVIGSDIEPRRSDITARDALSLGKVPNVVTNPPYSCLKRLVPHWLATVEHRLAILVRLNFLEAQSRVPWLTGDNEPEHVIVIAGRMKVFDKTSQFPHCWVVWNRRQSCTTKLHIRPVKK